MAHSREKIDVRECDSVANRTVKSVKLGYKTIYFENCLKLYRYIYTTCNKYNTSCKSCSLPELL